MSGAVIFVLSAANSDLYIASRTLFALAEEGHAPAFFLTVNKYGCPYYALVRPILLIIIAR